MIRHMFPGNNTPNGFFSYFNYINPFNESEKTIYIKGGSGTGKSTFMKKAGRSFEDLNMDVEYFHCSNDPDSLDGIYIPEKKIAIMDATAPHTMDPLAPAAIDEIINAADCLTENLLRPHREELKTLLSHKKEYVKHAYGYLKACYSLYENNTLIYEHALKTGELYFFTDNIISHLFSDYKPQKILGTNRKLFASAITPSGLLNYFDSLFHHENLYILSGPNGCGISYFLNKIQEAANIRGFNTQGFYSPLNPLDLEHLIIPELNLYFTTSNQYHKVTFTSKKEIQFLDFCISAEIESWNEEIQYNTRQFEELLHKAMKTLKDSGRFHSRIEEIYISAMDFEQLNILYDRTIEKLLQ